ncbi:hypothetical protein TrCOL_g8708 [Triparma columacea]|uniref:Uncharacterized protein n=1 Tax=Triparma columacea TaxID=722753 RepID=A0A9W7GIM1_9STRA|nr:hypothetical protein TrCOL_g8708 [Triparma columacea]
MVFPSFLSVNLPRNGAFANVSHGMLLARLSFMITFIPTFANFAFFVTTPLLLVVSKISSGWEEVLG